MRNFFFSLIVMVIASGCITSQPSKFYILTPGNFDGPILSSSKDAVDQSEKDIVNQPEKYTVDQHESITLGIGPVRIAKYLDRSQLVVRLGPNEINVEDFHQWAGNPGEDIPEVLTENFRQILGVDTIYKYPWKSYVETDYQIIIEILQLDGIPGDAVSLVARWEILQGNTRKLLKNGHVNLKEAVTGGGFDNYVAAQSRALGKLTKIIVDAL
ncbi:conserved exported hypothetical protein [Desulfamplus magnetovallimortis]|uniref:ABC-type transport auxiliary lipoprotein component domain-containing protein n=1 Tax=Desulfamplus magnetovallimortis TaxID=1246637 RepID=A0A1W1H618_9BACT|nr:PqiC family protein [Desulfamplus magnetovallimortis]SLM27930.1 conserved exported hypothetical protein [Desulfamplus magnetovallimortis]